MSSPGIVSLGLETSLFFVLRAGIFLSARKYLLRSLYHDLKGLSEETEPLTAASQDDVELETLPTPSTAGIPSADGSQIPQKRALHSAISRAIFALCFSESSILFILLMCQTLDLFHARTRLLNWQISLCLLLASIVVFIPFSYSLVLSYRSASGLQSLQRPTLARLGLFAIPIGVFLFLLSFIPIPPGAGSHGMITNVLSRLTAVGTVILGALSGFGAIDNACRYLPWLSRKGKIPTDEDVSVAEEGLQRVRQDLAERRRSIERMQAERPKNDSSWFSKVVPSFGGSSQMSSATQEVVGLEALEYQMSRNLTALREQQREAHYSQTLTGRLLNYGGFLFAMYCVYRIITAIVNLIIPSRSRTSPDSPGTSRTDLITVWLAYLFSLVPVVHVGAGGVAMIARQISLGLVGVIILTSIRLVLRGVARVLRVTSRNLGASLMLLMLAQLMGIYLLTTLIQLRTSFPPPPTRPDAEPDVGIVNLFSTLPEYQIFGSLFDSSFLVTAAVTAVVRWFSHRINSVGVIED